MKLILKNLKQVEYDIFITSGNITVKEFKKEIERLYSFDSEQIKLIFNGTVLENDKTLEQYQIKENNHIIIMNTKTKIIKNEEKPKPIEYQEKSVQIKPEIGPKDKPNISQILSDNWTIQVNSLVDMGFERSQVEAAVKAANGRIDLAVEYLNNGIPDNKVNNNNNRNRNNNIQRQKNKDDITKELKKQAGVIKMLCKDNKFRIFEILNNIKSNDPGLMRLITDYRDDFKNYLDSPITEEDKQNYEKIEAEADKIQQERKEKKEKEKKEKEEKEKKEKEEKEKEEKEKLEKEEKENEKKEDKNEEKKEDEMDGKDKNKEEISKEEKNENENENKMEEEKEKNEENKEQNKPGENMEDKQEEKDDNKSNNTEPKKDDNMNKEEENKNIEKDNNENKKEIPEKIDENEKKKEIAEENKEEKKETDEDNKNKEKVIENKESKDKGQEMANNKIEDNGNNPLINQLTEEEKEAVNRIKSLCDFSFQTVAEAYIACNKNEELTANFLFENM